MEPDVGNLPFAVELKLQLSGMSFERGSISDFCFSPPDFSKLDTLDAPFFWGEGFFGRNNLGNYPDEKFGVNCQHHGQKEARISDGIRVTVYNNDGKRFGNGTLDYSFASLYAENETIAEIKIYLVPNVFEKISMARNSVHFYLITSFYEHSRITKELFKGRDKYPDNIVVEGTPGWLSITDKFTLNIREGDFGYWFFRVRLVCLGFPSLESPQASEY